MEEFLFIVIISFFLLRTTYIRTETVTKILRERERERKIKKKRFMKRDKTKSIPMLDKKCMYRQAQKKYDLER